MATTVLYDWTRFWGTVRHYDVTLLIECKNSQISGYIDDVV